MKTFLVLFTIITGLALAFNHVHPIGEHNYVGFFSAYFGGVCASITLAFAARDF